MHLQSMEKILKSLLNLFSSYLDQAFGTCTCAMMTSRFCMETSLELSLEQCRTH